MSEVSAEMEKFIEYVETMSVLELTKLVSALEDRLGVSAAAPVAVAAAGAAAPAEAAEGARFVGIEAPRGEADDLKLVAGIDARIQQQLSGIGVYHYWQIADLDEANLALLAAELKMEASAISEADWVGSAKKLVAANAA